MQIQELNKDSIIIDWLDTLGAKPNTISSRVLAMQHFTEYTGKTPEELLKEAEEEIRAGKLMRERQVKKQLIGFRKLLENGDYAPITVKSYMAGVRSFYRVFDIDLPTLPKAGEKARPQKKRLDVPDKDEIREVLKVCDLREKAIILVGLSSGLSANEISNLKLDTFKKGYDPETEITTLDLRREKVGFDFITFLTPEATRAVWDYLAYRDREIHARGTVRKQQLEKQRTVEGGYLFITNQVANDYLIDYDEKHRRITTSVVSKIYRAIARKAGRTSPSGDWNKIRSHNMRKMFNSALINAGCDNFYIEYWMGHTLNDTQAAYFRANPEQMKERYQQYIPYLTIQKELDVSESPEYQEIKKENQVLQAETARHVVERSEMADLKKQLDEMREHQDALSEIFTKLGQDPATLQEVIKKGK
jgi:integrase